MAKPMLMRIHKEIVEILAEADTIKRIHNVGSIAVGNDPEVFRKFLIADMEKWKDVVKRSGAKLE
jgi:tripartite-type tricarboxylate transporter receptor subunit TctC